jgi:dihydrofolate reductase
MSRAYVELIAAVGPHWELGHKGGMPWGRIKGDLAHFASVTKGKAVIMGRRTWESLPPAHRPLKGRLNVVLSRDVLWSQQQLILPGAMFMAGSGGLLDYAIRCARSEHLGGVSQIVIIGGGEVYRAALEADLVDVIHLSVIHTCEIEAWQREAAGWGSQAWAFRGAPGWEHDVTFPALKWEGWALTETVRHEPDGGARYGWTQLRLVRDPAHPALQDTTKVVGGLPLDRLEKDALLPHLREVSSDCTAQVARFYLNKRLIGVDVPGAGVVNVSVPNADMFKKGMPVPLRRTNGHYELASQPPRRPGKW